MKINQILTESTGATVAFAFGRFNPAHQGHIEVWRTVEQAGANWFIGTNPSTLGPNDPLTFEQKSYWMEEIYPPISGHIVPEQSVLTLAAYIFKKLRKNERASIAYVTDATDWSWSGKLLNQYNGVEGSHGYYKFAEITHVPSPRVSSATALRDAARADDKVAFYHASGTDPKLKVAGLTYFDTVKQACEKYPLPVKRAKKVKEQDVAEGLEHYNGIEISMEKEDDEITVKAMMAGGRKLGHVLFVIDGEYLMPQDLEVDERYQGQGIAATMYNYVKSKGYKIRRSGQQTDAGAGFWDKHKPGKNVWEQRVAEDEQKTVAKTWDQMTPQEKISGVKGRTVWNEKTRKYYTVFDVPVKQDEVDEASLATMRDYFAGDEKARDPYDITKQRLHFAKDKNAKPTIDKRFRSQEEYEQWLEQNKLKPISNAKGWSLINKNKS
jgi:GNAT superfamily N-acetyltransferase